MSFHYWRNTGQTGKTQFISLQNGYHGETLGALSVTDVALFKDQYAPLLRQSEQMTSPDFRLAEVGESEEAYALRSAGMLESHLQQHADKTAAFILEPLVQGAAGMAMYHPVYLARARELCTKYQVHLIADEIAVGFGRTGTMFACEQAIPPSPSGRGVGGEGALRFHDLPSESIKFARSLRRSQTDAESLMWRLLRDRGLGGFKFRRQHPMPPYTLDFYCHDAALVVELDGGQHADSRHDEERDAWLRARGLQVLRFWNNQVLQETESVLEAVWHALVENPRPHPQPLSRRERGECSAAGKPDGIRPDFMCLSKGITGGYLPLSCVLTTDGVFAAFYADETARGFLHSHSYTGNPLACRAALAVLDIFEQDRVLETNRARAERFSALLEPVKRHHRVRHFRNRGMVWAFDVADATQGFSTRAYQAALKNGVLLRPIGKTVYFMPPYVIGEEEMTKMAMVAQSILDEIE
jgi:adenosylmethionine-8-amino-7-oxononanoate aminotransferase/very-short-patch-repair endonuclease